MERAGGETGRPKARAMAVVRGKGRGLEIGLEDGPIDEALAELDGQLAERPGFYRGSNATLAVRGERYGPVETERVREVLERHGISLTDVVHREEGEELARRRALRPAPGTQISDAARSLVADFAGARADIAERRRRGQTSVRRVAAAAAATAIVPAGSPIPQTLYHVGTLRGGQSLAHPGHVVVVGDVNPGAEIVAAGDIVVFGALRGVAHAGAQGDASARVYALQLAPTQLRIATCIAVDEGDRGSQPIQPERACVENDRIVIREGIS